jgi:hypothetical protein
MPITEHHPHRTGDAALLGSAGTLRRAQLRHAALQPIGCSRQPTITDHLVDAGQQIIPAIAPDGDRPHDRDAEHGGKAVGIDLEAAMAAMSNTLSARSSAGQQASARARSGAIASDSSSQRHRRGGSGFPRFRAASIPRPG